MVGSQSRVGSHSRTDVHPAQCDELQCATISAVVVIQGHQDITTGIAIAVPLAAAGQVLTIFVRTITVFFQHQADNFAKTATSAVLS